MYGVQLEEGEMYYSTAHSGQTADITGHWSQANTVLFRNWVTQLACTLIGSKSHNFKMRKVLEVFSNHSQFIASSHYILFYERHTLVSVFTY